MGCLKSLRYPSRAPPLIQRLTHHRPLAATVHYGMGVSRVSRTQADPHAALTGRQGYGNKDHFG